MLYECYEEAMRKPCKFDANAMNTRCKRHEYATKMLCIFTAAGAVAVAQFAEVHIYSPCCSAIGRSGLRAISQLCPQHSSSTALTGFRARSHICDHLNNKPPCE